MNQHRNDAEEIKQRLNERLEQVLDHFWPSWVKRGRVAYCAPKNKDDLGSFQVHLASQGTHARGSWNRYSAGIGGDELNLFAYGQTGAHKVTSADVFQRAREFVGLSREREETDLERQSRERRQKAARLKREREEQRAARAALRKAQTVAEILKESAPIAGTLAEVYLHGRGIPTPPDGWPDSLRFHSGLEYELGAEFEGERKIKNGPVFAALVAKITNVADEPIAVWRIYLSAEGKKAPVPDPKVGLGPASGGAVRLGGIGSIVGAGEGLESSLGAWSLINYRHPVWATLSTSGMMNVEFPYDVQTVPIFPDGDQPWKKERGELVPSVPAGRAAAQKLLSRCKELGIEAVLQSEPPMLNDYLDVWNDWQRLEEAI